MSDGSKLVWALVGLAALLVGVAYYAGLSTDVKTISAATNSFAQVVTGRNSNNQFAAYPGGFVQMG